MQSRKSMQPLRCACLVDQRGSKLLLVRVRQNEHWYLPGGKIEPAEAPEEALRRELAEELDVQVRAVLGSGRDGDGRFEDAARFL